jgi:uncharacterized membrane protein YkvA (DUF1232 family)
MTRWIAAARVVPDALVLIRRLATDRRVPRRARWMLGGVAAYLAFPFDLIPDFIPVLGQLDDVVVVALALRAVVRSAGPEILAERWSGTPEGLELVRRLAG